MTSSDLDHKTFSASRKLTGIVLMAAVILAVLFIAYCVGQILMGEWDSCTRKRGTRGREVEVAGGLGPDGLNRC